MRRLVLEIPVAIVVFVWADRSLPLLAAAPEKVGATSAPSPSAKSKAAQKPAAAHAAPSKPQQQQCAKGKERFELGPQAAKERIEKALATPTSLEFVDTPLNDVIDYLKSVYGIEIFFDRRSLEDAGIAPDSPITKSVKGVTLRSALNLLLPDLELTWVIQNEVLLITTREKADSLLTTEVYNVVDLVETSRDENDELWIEFDALIDVITSTVKPSSWDSVGGPGSIASHSYNGNNAKVLVISQTREVHEQVAELFAQMRSIKPVSVPMTTPPLKKRISSESHSRCHPPQSKAADNPFSSGRTCGCGAGKHDDHGGSGNVKH